MEPVEAACGLCRNLRRQVVAPYVDQFMQQHGVQPFHRPTSGRLGQQHDGAHHPPRHGHRRARTLQRAHRPSDGQLATYGVRQCLGIRSGPRLPHHPHRAHTADHKSRRHQNQSHQVRDQPLRPAPKPPIQLTPKPPIRPAPNPPIQPTPELPIGAATVSERSPRAIHACPRLRRRPSRNRNLRRYLHRNRHRQKRHERRRPDQMP